MRRALALVAGAALMGMLAACGAKPDQGVAKRSEQPSWDAAADPFVVTGWKSGDKASWQQQMTVRAQNQNEYLRVH
jgi:hypothetical protein